jgi:2-hydroxy-6-oxonona-2,4-dienedioate hydrolase
MSIWTDLLGVDFKVVTVDAGGVPTRALQAGEGPDVVFLHGTSGHLEAFSRNIRAYVAAGYRCHAIDMLGHGLTGKPDFDYTIPRYSDHLRDYLDACGIERVHLVGESLGGWVSSWFSSEHPERVATLALVAAGGTKANPEVMDRIRRTTTAAVESDDPTLTRERLNLLLHDPEKDVTDELVDVRFRIYTSPEFRKGLPHLLCLQNVEIRTQYLLEEERMARITAPTLIVWPRQNPFGNLDEAERTHAGIAGSRLEVFENCGHWPQYEQTEQFNELHLAFLADKG